MPNLCHLSWFGIILYELYHERPALSAELYELIHEIRYTVGHGISLPLLPKLIINIPNIRSLQHALSLKQHRLDFLPNLCYTIYVSAYLANVY